MTERYFCGAISELIVHGMGDMPMPKAAMYRIVAMSGRYWTDGPADEAQIVSSHPLWALAVNVVFALHA